jgi:hypothetical protein
VKALHRRNQSHRKTKYNTMEDDKELLILVDEAKELKVWSENYADMLESLPSALKGLLRDAIARENLAIARENRFAREKKDAIARENRLRDDAAREKNRVRRVLAACMQETYMKEGNFSLPAITLNASVTPSINGNERSVTIVTENGIQETVKLQIPKAKIKKLETQVWMDPKAVKIPFQYKDESLASSELGSKYLGQDCSTFSYANEFDVQNLVIAIVSDAIQALGLPRKVKAHLEITMYTLWPDMVVVLQHEGRMIFVIEVKSPGKGDEVFSSENAGGQIWSYLHAMKQLGNDLPMGAIMTYNKIALVTLEDCGAGEDHKSLLQHTSAVLSTGIIQERKAPAKDPDCKLPRVSPIRTHKRVSKTVLAQTVADPPVSEFEETELSRDIFYSKVYKDGEVFPCLVQALEMAYHHCKEIHILKDLPVVHHGDDLGKRLFFKVKKDGYSWVITPQKYRKEGKPCDFRANMGELPTKGTKHFYMLGRAGEGSEGAVYIACNSSARLCAIKVYHIDKTSAATNKQREYDEKKASAECWKKAEEECKLWTKIYKERFKHVRPLYLGGRPCLLLPYGLEIETHDKRTALLLDVEAELSMIAKCHLRYKYSDLRWRHVLLDSEGKLFLSDLGSLEPFIPSETEGIERVVRKQMKALENAQSQDDPSERATLKRKCPETAGGES